MLPVEVMNGLAHRMGNSTSSIPRSSRNLTHDSLADKVIVPGDAAKAFFNLPDGLLPGPGCPLFRPPAERATRCILDIVTIRCMLRSEGA